MTFSLQHWLPCLMGLFALCSCRLGDRRRHGGTIRRLRGESTPPGIGVRSRRLRVLLSDGFRTGALGHGGGCYFANRRISVPDLKYSAVSSWAIFTSGLTSSNTISGVPPATGTRHSVSSHSSVK